jgi:hypothetical protein
MQDDVIKGRFFNFDINTNAGDDEGNVGDYAVLNDMLRDALAYKKKHTVRYEKGILYVAGEQNIIATVSGGCTINNLEGKDSKKCVNVMEDAFIGFKSDMYKNKPVLQGHGSGNEIKKAEFAKVASKLFDYWNENLGWRLEDERVFDEVYFGGVGYMFVDWDDGSNEPVFSGCGSLNVHAFPLSVDSWEKKESVLRSDLVTLMWLENWLGRVLTDEELDSISKYSSGLIDSNVGEMLVSGRSTGSLDFVGKRPSDDVYLYLEYRERPSVRYPRGRFIVVVGGVEFKRGDLKYVDEFTEVDPSGVYNIFMGVIPWIPKKLPRVYLGRSVVSGQLPLQDDINDGFTAQKRNRDTVGKNRLIVEDGEDIAKIDGEIIPVPAGTSVPPQYLRGEALVGIGQEIGVSLDMFSRLAGIKDSISGNNPTQVRSGLHLDMLIEQASKPMREFARSHELFLGRVGKMVLALAKRRYNKEKIISIYGADDAGLALTVLDDDNLISTDIVVTEGSTFPRNMASKELKIMELVKSGFFDNNPEGGFTKADALKMLELGDIEFGVNTDYKSAKRQQYENYIMLAGEPIEPYSFDNHDIHLREIDDFMARQDFYESSDDVKSLFMAHRETHIQMLGDMMSPDVNSAPRPMEGLVSPDGVGSSQLGGGAGVPPVTKQI